MPGIPVAFIPVALPAEVALVPVMFSCAMAVSLPMTDNNPESNAAATNIPVIGIAAVALVVLVLLLVLSGPLRGFINVNEGI